MEKFLLLVVRHPNCALPDFADYLDTRLVPELTRAAPYSVVSRVNTLIPGATVAADHIIDVPPPPPFDVVIEGWLPGPGDIVRLRRDIGHVLEAGSRTDSARNSLLSVEAQATPETDLPASAGARNDGSMVKMLIKLQRRPGTSRAFFRDYYESNHAPLAAKHLPMIAGYQRNYVIAELPASIGTDDKGVRPVEEADAFVEFWFRDEAAFKSMSAAFTDPVNGPMFARDEERLFDRTNIQMFLVKERVILSESIAPVRAALR